MMHITALIVAAQALMPGTPVSIVDVTDGSPVYLAPIEADKTVPGTEILVYLPGTWVVSIGRWHPSKHGVAGRLAGAGLCVEHWTWIAPIDSAIGHYMAILDGNGDGVDEFLIYVEVGRIVPYTSTGLRDCRCVR